MNRKLLLPSSSFPNLFESSAIEFPSIPALKIQYMEETIMNAINSFNPKLKISNIEYVEKIKDQFPHLDFFGKYISVIVEDIEIEESQQAEYTNKQYYVWEFNNIYFARRILIYTFIADLQVVGRNTFCQTFFPELIDFMNCYHSSPSFSIANHPIYFINFEYKDYPDSIIRQAAGLIASDIEYMEVFNQNDDLVYVPKNIREYLNKFEDDFNSLVQTYSSDFFEIDFVNKSTTIKTNKLVLGDYLELKQNGKYDFNGSSEKFYWIEILPIIFLSIKNEYKLDYTLLENFYATNNPHFSSGSRKIERFDFLIKFIKKFISGVNR